MNQIKLFIELTRLKKPIGFLLLFWPCSWGLTLAYDFSSDLNKYLNFLKNRKLKLNHMHMAKIKACNQLVFLNALIQ